MSLFGKWHSIKKGEWVGFDLDGVLAEYHHWDDGKIGAPIPKMIARVKEMLDAGIEVRIFTARVSDKVYPEQVEANVTKIRAFCYANFRRILTITCEKDQNMILLFDDRAIQVIKNKGITLHEQQHKDLD